MVEPADLESGVIHQVTQGDRISQKFAGVGERGAASSPRLETSGGGEARAQLDSDPQIHPKQLIRCFLLGRGPKAEARGSLSNPRDDTPRCCGIIPSYPIPQGLKVPNLSSACKLVALVPVKVPFSGSFLGQAVARCVERLRTKGISWLRGPWLAANICTLLRVLPGQDGQVLETL